MSENLLKTGKCKEVLFPVEIDNTPELTKTIQKNFQSAFVFALFKDKALFGKVSDGTLQLYDSDYELAFPMIEEMRVFNKKKELYVYKNVSNYFF